MTNLAVLFRSLQLLAHNGHSVTIPATLFADHAFFGELRGCYELAYDGLMERLANGKDSPDLVQIQVDAAKDLEARSLGLSSAVELFRALLIAEDDLCGRLRELVLHGGWQDEAWGEWVGGYLKLLEADAEVRGFKIASRLEGCAA
jgi:hypothetical protein